MTKFSEIAPLLEGQAIEVPSWAYGNSGTRFKVFGQPGVARDPYEKLEDAAQVHRYTGVAPRVSLHIPWDLVDDFGKLGAHAADLGLSIGAINSTVMVVLSPGMHISTPSGNFTEPVTSVVRKKNWGR